MQAPRAVGGKWWERIPTFVNCYHPYARRYHPCAQVEKCGECGELRWAGSPRYWPPVSKECRKPIAT